MQHMVRLVVIVVAVALAAAVPAGAVGPWPGTVNVVVSATTGERFSVTSDGTTTELVAVREGRTRKLQLRGTWRVPAVTSTELPGGLSPDGKLLVLAQVSPMNGLRTASRFAVVSTTRLALRRMVVLKGEFGFDAVSADRRTLYVIEHRDEANLNSYIVRAYDLAQGKLVAEPVVAKGEGATMSGYPIARVATTRGTWVYTLYWRSDGTTFIHALATVQRRAVCLDLEWVTGNGAWTARLELSRDGKRLLVHGPGGAIVAQVATPA
jgi:hypothetical protein